MEQHYELVLSPDRSTIHTHSGCLLISGSVFLSSPESPCIVHKVYSVYTARTLVKAQRDRHIGWKRWMRAILGGWQRARKVVRASKSMK